MRCRWALVSLVLLAAAPIALCAQAVTGALEGRVLSREGEPLEQVIVSVSSPFLQGTRSLTTDAGGRFIFLALPPGSYGVQARRMGYRPSGVASVAVRLGATATVGEVRLEPAAVEVAAIEVSGERPLVDPVSTSDATSRDSSFFRQIPTPRDFQNLVALSPVSAPSPFTQNLGPTVAGATEVENGYYIDGIDVTGLGEYTVTQRKLPFNFVREVQVLTGGADADFGRTMGGSLNAVTNSGGNTFRGQLLGFFTGNRLRATPRLGYAEAQPSAYADWDVGVSLSGPIQRDRLWYFIAYEPTFRSTDVAFTGLATKQNRSTQHLFAGKVTWRAGEFTDVVATALGDPQTSTYFNAGLANIASWDAVSEKGGGGGGTFALQLRRQRGRTLLTASVARSTEGGTYRPVAAYTDILSPMHVNDYTTNTVSGTGGVDSYGRNRRAAAQVALTYAGERHTIKLGAEFQDNYSLIVPLWSVLNITTDATHPYQWTLVDQRLEGWSRVPTLYLQDSWAATPQLRINAGVRWDGNWMSGPNGLQRHIVNQVSPRLGVVYQPKDAGRSKVTASLGRYYEQIPPYSAGIWGGLGHYMVKGYAVDPRANPTASADTIYYFSAFARPDAHLRGQYHDEVSLGYERVLGNGLKLGLRGVARSLRWAIDDAPIGPDGRPITDPAIYPNGPYMFGNPGRGAMASRPKATREYRALELTLERTTAGSFSFLLSYVLSSNRGNYGGLYPEDFPNTFGGSNAGIGLDLPDTNAYSSGSLPNDRTRLLKFSGAYRIGAVATLGATFVAASGTPRSEVGAQPWGWPYVVLITPRGSLGRTPWTWDLNLRASWAILARGAIRPRLLLDVFHVGNPRTAVEYNDIHYDSPPTGGVWGTPSLNYGKVIAYQPPMYARLGMQIDF